MDCPKCGGMVSDGAAFCGHCGARLAENAQEKEPGGTVYTVLAALELLLCCWPAAIPALVYAVKIFSCKGRGDDEGARRCARLSRVWLIISAVLGLVATAFYTAMIYMYQNGMLNEYFAVLNIA